MATSVGLVKIHIDTSDISKKVVKRLQKAKRSMPEFIDTWVTVMGDAAIDYAIPLTRVRTGKLISSYKMSDIVHQNDVTGLYVYNFASDNGIYSYAGFNEFGTMYMAPRLMLSTARERIINEAPEQIETALIKLIRGDSVGRYTFKLD